MWLVWISLFYIIFVFPFITFVDLYGIFIITLNAYRVAAGRALSPSLFVSIYWTSYLFQQYFRLFVCSFVAFGVFACFVYVRAFPMETSFAISCCGSHRPPGEPREIAAPLAGLCHCRCPSDR